MAKSKPLSTFGAMPDPTPFFWDSTLVLVGASGHGATARIEANETAAGIVWEMFREYTLTRWAVVHVYAAAAGQCGEIIGSSRKGKAIYAKETPGPAAG
jgi:hypothetical protein